MKNEIPIFYLTDSDKEKIFNGFETSYTDVRGFFEAVAPDLTKKLDQGGSFWSKVADNSVSDRTLEMKLLALHMQYRYDPGICRASYLLLTAREKGVLPASVR